MRARTAFDQLAATRGEVAEIYRRGLGCCGVAGSGGEGTARPRCGAGGFAEDCAVRAVISWISCCALCPISARRVSNGPAVGEGSSEARSMPRAL